jgi:methionyl-tRNA formyltransferase
MSAAPRYYLFCNLRFGARFTLLAREHHRRTGARWTVVLSSRGASPQFSSELRARWRVARLRVRLGVPVRRVADVNAPEFAAALEPGAHGIVAGFNQIFHPATIARFASLVNLHPSVLPHYRGPLPSHWVLERGESASGFTLHRVSEAIDAGEVLFQGRVEVGGARTADELDERIAEAALPAVEAWIDHTDRGGVWTPCTLETASVYRRPVDYLSFPG